MTTKQLTNEALIRVLKNLVTDERKITAQILEYLHEVEVRKIHLPLGYPNLFEFCIKELGYSEGSAYRRISAMRLLKDVPEVQEKIVSGELSLSVVAQAQNFFKKQQKKNEAYDKSEKLELLASLENASTRECEKRLLQINPEPVRKDMERPITDQLTELRFTVSADFMQKIEKLKNLLSNAKPDVSTQEVLALALDQLLAKKDLTCMQDAIAKQNNASPRSAQKLGSRTQNSSLKKSRYIPKSVRRQVWQKSEGRCCYVNPETGRRCHAQRFLHIDHMHACSRGGTSAIENLQLLCSSHNIWKADGFGISITRTTLQN